MNAITYCLSILNGMKYNVKRRHNFSNLQPYTVHTAAVAVRPKSHNNFKKYLYIIKRMESCILYDFPAEINLRQKLIAL